MKVRTLLAFITVLIGVVIIYGFYVSQYPLQQDRGTDLTRVSDLNRLLSAVQMYYKDHGSLPNALKNLQNEPRNGLNLTILDPDTKREYEYYVINPTSFELCGNFKTNTGSATGLRAGQTMSFNAHPSQRFCQRLTP